jgi:RNA polymerase sigma-B factor
VSSASAGSQLELLRAFHERRDLGARDRLIEDNIPLVRAMARRYAGRGEQYEDLVQIGTIGLIKAIDRFDLERGVELQTYAIPNIVGEIKRHFRDQSWAVHVPRRLKELNLKLTQLVDQLNATLGRSPTIAELAKAAGVDTEEAVEAIEAGRGYSALSLSVPVGDDPDTELGDVLPDASNPFGAADDRAFLTRGLDCLDERERQIIQLRFFDGLTQSQIAREINVSQMHVSRLIRRSLEKMRREIDVA